MSLEPKRSRDVDTDGPVFLGCSKAATMLRMSVLAFINAAVTGAAGITAIAGVT